MKFNNEKKRDAWEMEKKPIHISVIEDFWNNK